MLVLPTKSGGFFWSKKGATFTEVRYSYTSETRYGTNHNIAIQTAPSPHLRRMGSPVRKKMKLGLRFQTNIVEIIIFS